MDDLGGQRSLKEVGTEGYVAVRASVGLVVRDDVAVVRMSGRDPVKMLNGLITNDLGLLAPDRAVYAAMLTAKGRMITDLRVLRTSTPEVELVVMVPRSALEATIGHFRKFIPPMYARWEVLEWSVLGCYGPRSSELLAMVTGAAADVSEDRVTLTTSPFGAAIVGSREGGGEPGFEILQPSAVPSLEQALETSARTLGGGRLSLADFEVLRVEAGNPRHGVDYDEETLPGELYDAPGRMERAISFSKGCYTGQEVVVRIAHRGHVNRHLRGLLLGSSALPAFRTDLRGMDGGKTVGWTTSSAWSPRLGQTIALGMVRREVQPGNKVMVGEGAIAEVVELPFA